MFRRTNVKAMMAAAAAVDPAELPEAFQVRLPDLIRPKWWTGPEPSATYPPVDPKRFTIDCSKYQGKFFPNTSAASHHDDLQLDVQVASDLGAEMNAKFDATGLVYLENTGFSSGSPEDLAKMRLLAKLVMKKEMIYKGGSNNRNKQQNVKNVYDVGAPLQAWLHYHHEMAYVASSTEMLGFMCKKSPPKHRALAGATFLSDSVQATDALLKTDLGKKLKDLGVCYCRDMTDRDYFRKNGLIEEGVYNHWQQSMMTENPEEAVAIAQEKGLKTSWGPNRLLESRFYVSAFEYAPMLDRNLLYCSVADDGMWFDSWPLVQHLPYDQRPLRLNFGDDSRMSLDEKRKFVEVYDQFGLPAQWQPGDVALVCNYRWAHGRPAVELLPGEERDLGVMIGQPFDRVGDKPGKW